MLSVGLFNVLHHCWCQARFRVQGEKVYHCGNYAIVFCYYCFKCLINVSLFTGWPFAKVRADLVLAALVFFPWYHSALPVPPDLFISKVFIHSCEVSRKFDNVATFFFFFSFLCFLNCCKTGHLLFLLQDNVLTFSLSWGHTSPKNLIPQHSKGQVPLDERSYGKGCSSLRKSVG